MKTKFLVASTAALVLAAVAGLAFLRSSAGFDFLQRVKYPEYYSWKSGKTSFTKEHFWIGLNTDRHRSETFVGKSLNEIQKSVPILIPSERRKDPHFMTLDQSYWTLQFDDSGHCVRFFLDKA